MNYFTKQQVDEMLELIELADMHIGHNDKRVTNALDRVFEIIIGRVKYFSRERTGVLDEMYQIHNEGDLKDLVAEYFLAAENTAQYDRCLERINDFLELGIFDKRENEDEKVHLLAVLGKFEEAEKIMLSRLEKDSDDVWTYIRLGDIYYHDQIFDEKKDYKKAEFWYYKAYDRGKTSDDDDDWESLLERLKDVCIDRLRSTALVKLEIELIKKDFRGAETIEQFKENVYLRSSDSPIFLYFQSSALAENDIAKANTFLKILTNAYNLLPQERLDELSPFEMAHYFPPGEHEARIRAEMMNFCTEFLQKEQVDFSSAFGSERFSQLQVEFMKKVDLVTGKIRGKLIEKERKVHKKSYESGTFIWTGFTEFRGRDL